MRETQRTSKLSINSPNINVNDIVLVSDEKVPIHFWRTAIVTWVLPNRVSEIRRAIVRIAKTNTILKRPVNKLFTVENTCYDTNQTDNAREQKQKGEAAVIGEQKIAVISDFLLETKGFRFDSRCQLCAEVTSLHQ